MHQTPKNQKIAKIQSLGIKRCDYRFSFCGSFWAMARKHEGCTMLRLIKSLKRNEKGVTMLEYALIAALVAIAAVTILATLGTTVSSVFSNVNANMS